jgi:predicted acyltransferase
LTESAGKSAYLEKLMPKVRLRAPERAPLPNAQKPVRHAEAHERFASHGPGHPAPARLASVDALRGFSMIGILGLDGMARAIAEMTRDHEQFAAAGAAIHRQFSHPSWEGFTFYELIFPLFIFVTGVAIVLSLPRIVEQEGMARAQARVFRRSLLLFGLGILFYGGLSNPWPEIRLLGVLQRIALCYLFASLLFLHLRPRRLAVVLVSLLVGYWALLTFVPVPDVGAPTYAEGLTLTNWIDRNYLPGRRWYGEWDPEGLLSTIPAVATCLLGVFAGLLLRDARLTPQQKSPRLVAGGLALVVAGHLWGLQFPVIKNIWTSSYVLVAGGWSLLLLGIFHEVIDVGQRGRWATVLIWIGASAIVIYLAYFMFDFVALARRFVGGDVGRMADEYVAPGTADLLACSVALAMAIALAGFLYRRKIFLRI